MIDDIKHDHSINIVYEENTNIFSKDPDDISYINNTDIVNVVSIKNIGNNHVIYLPLKFINQYIIYLPYLQPPNNVPQAV